MFYLAAVGWIGRVAGEEQVYTEAADSLHGEHADFSDRSRSVDRSAFSGSSIAPAKTTSGQYDHACAEEGDPSDVSAMASYKAEGARAPPQALPSWATACLRMTWKSSICLSAWRICARKRSPSLAPGIPAVVTSCSTKSASNVALLGASILCTSAHSQVGSQGNLLFSWCNT